MVKQLILQKSSHKDLGITFTANLQWSEHYKVIAAKAYRTWDFSIVLSKQTTFK